MTEEKIKIAVRFYGGAGNYVEYLRDMLGYIASSNPSRDELFQWVKTNTRAESDGGFIDDFPSLSASVSLALIMTLTTWLSEDGSV